MSRTIQLSAAFLLIQGSIVCAQISWDKRQIDYVIPAGETHCTVEFVGKNMLETSLQIARVKVSCGCSTSLTHELTVQPNEIARLPVNVNMSEPGFKSVTVALQYQSGGDVDRLILNISRPPLFEVKSKRNDHLVTFSVKNLSERKLMIKPYGTTACAFLIQGDVLEPHGESHGTIDLNKTRDSQFAFLRIVTFDGVSEIKGFSLHNAESLR